jgi:hypothetical protein
MMKNEMIILLCVGTAAAKIEQLIGEVLTLCWNRRGKD